MKKNNSLMVVFKEHFLPIVLNFCFGFFVLALLFLKFYIVGWALRTAFF